MRMNMGCAYLLCFCMECVSCPSVWCVCVVCVVHMGYVVFTYGCMLIGCVVSPVMCGI